MCTSSFREITKKQRVLLQRDVQFTVSAGMFVSQLICTYCKINDLFLRIKLSLTRLVSRETLRTISITVLVIKLNNQIKY